MQNIKMCFVVRVCVADIVVRVQMGRQVLPNRTSNSALSALS